MIPWSVNVTGRPVPPGLEVLAPQFKDSFDRLHSQISRNPQSLYATLFPKAMALELIMLAAMIPRKVLPCYRSWSSPSRPWLLK